MDAALMACVEEVSFEGTQGCSLSHLWTLLERRIQKQHGDSTENTPKADTSSLLRSNPATCHTSHQGMLIDATMRQFLWRQMLLVRDFSFYHGKPPNHKDDINMVDRDVLSKIPLDGIKKEFPSDIFIVTSLKELQKIFKIHQSKVPITDNVLEVLCVIVKAREKGISQASISWSLGKDPRSTFYTIKVLKSAGLNYPVLHAGQRTQNCVHIRFRSECAGYFNYLKSLDHMAQIGNSSEPTSILLDEQVDSNEQQAFVIDREATRESMSALIMSTSNHVMAIEDIYLALKFENTLVARKSFFRFLGYFCSEGYADRVDVYPATDGRRKGIIKCIRGLRPYISANKTRSFHSIAGADASSSKGSSMPYIPPSDVSMAAISGQMIKSGMPSKYRLLSNMPATTQIFDIIEESGSKGMLVTQISHEFGGLYSRMVSRIITCLSTTKVNGSPLLTIVSESWKKEHRHRMFSTRLIRDDGNSGDRTKDATDMHHTPSVAPPYTLVQTTPSAISSRQRSNHLASMKLPHSSPTSSLHSPRGHSPSPMHIDTEEGGSPHEFDPTLNPSSVHQDISIEIPQVDDSIPNPLSPLALDSEAIATARIVKDIGEPLPTVGFKRRLVSMDDNDDDAAPAVPAILPSRRLRSQQSTEISDIDPHENTYPTTPKSTKVLISSDNSSITPAAQRGVPETLILSSKSPVVVVEIPAMPKFIRRTPTLNTKSPVDIAVDQISGGSNVSDEPVHIDSNHLNKDMASPTDTANECQSLSNNILHTPPSVHLPLPERATKGISAPDTPSTDSLCDKCKLPVVSDNVRNKIKLCCEKCKKWFHGECRKPRVVKYYPKKWFCSKACRLYVAPDRKQRTLFDFPFKSTPNLVLLQPSPLAKTGAQTVEDVALSSTEDVDLSLVGAPLSKTGAQTVEDVSLSSTEDVLLSSTENVDISLVGAPPAPQIESNASLAKPIHTSEAIAPSPCRTNLPVSNINSTTHVVRSKLILDYLDQHNILVVDTRSGVTLAKFDFEKSNQDSRRRFNDKGIMDRRTIMRVAALLQEEGLLRAYSFSSSSLTGRLQLKTLLIHKSLTSESEIVVDYLKSLKSDMMLRPQGHIKRAERSDSIHVERLKRVDELEHSNLPDNVDFSDGSKDDHGLSLDSTGDIYIGDEYSGFEDMLQPRSLDSYSTPVYSGTYDFGESAITNTNNINLESDTDAYRDYRGEASGSGSATNLQVYSVLEPCNVPSHTPFSSAQYTTIQSSYPSSQGLKSIRSSSSQELDNAATTSATENDTDGDQDKSVNTTQRADPGRQAMLKYGYLDAKFVRARVFYEWLFTITVIRPVAGDEDSSNTTNGPSFPSMVRTNRIMASIRLFDELPLDIFVKCLGLYIDLPIADEVMKHPDYSTLTVGSLVPPFRNMVFGYRMRNGFIRVLSQLCLLKLIRVCDSKGEVDDATEKLWLEKMVHIPAFFRIERRVDLLDYFHEPPQLIRRMDIRTMMDVNSFWLRLENRCMAHAANLIGSTRKHANQKRDGKWTKYASDSSKDLLVDNTYTLLDDVHNQAYLNSPGAGVPLKEYASLFTARNWRIGLKFTSSQEKTLKSNVDYAAGTTPLHNDFVCRSLADETGLTITRVKYFFKQVEDKFHSKEKSLKIRAKYVNQEKAKLFSLNVRKTWRSIHTSGHEEKRADVYSSDHDTDSSMRKTHVGDQRARLLEFPSASRTASNSARTKTRIASKAALLHRTGILDPSETPFPDSINQQNASPFRPPTQRFRRIWSQEEDDIILLGYTIMLHRFGGPRISWVPVAKLLEASKIYDACRRRLGILLQSSLTIDRIYTLRQQWPSIYARGLAEGAFDSQPETKAVDFDLSVMVSYFQAEVVATTSNICDEYPNSTVDLPADYATLMRMYTLDTVKPSVSREFSVPMEEGIELCSSIRMKLAVLYGSPITIGGSSNRVADFPRSAYLENMDDENSMIQYVEHNKLRTIIKSILLTPLSMYDPSQAFLLLTCYSSDRLTTASSSLRKDGSITHAVGATDRRLPGRQYSLTDRFLTSITGPLPARIIPNALEVQQRLIRKLSKGPTVLDTNYDGATIAAVLTRLVSGSIRVDAEVDWDLSKEAEDQSVFIRLSSTVSAETNPLTRYPPSAKRGVIETEAISEDDMVDTVLESGMIKRPHIETDPSTQNEILTPPSAFPRGPQLVDVDMNRVFEGISGARSDVSLPHIKRIFHSIYSSGIIGSTFLKLHDEFMDDLSETALSICIDILISTAIEPHIFMISKVGYKAFHYVAFPFVHHWCIEIMSNSMSHSMDEQAVTSPSAKTCESMEIDQDLHPQLAYSPQLYSPTRLWITVDGKHLDAVWVACMESAIGVIVHKPGIYESRIQRFFSNSLSPVELHEVLNELVLRGACTREHYSFRTPLANLFDGLFDPPLQFNEPALKPRDATYQGSDRVTAYFPTMVWFEKTTMARL
ncbi:hypothetical protein BSLG_009937 [Batrachochytrium salamandrivorans]|nr:hypothetical protein BSLG_009937 [Batrachochytrium salamandrivorans]